MFLTLGCLMSFEELLKCAPDGVKLSILGTVSLVPFESLSELFAFVVGADDFWGIPCEAAGFTYWSVKFLAGGQARVLRGIVVGIGSLMKGSERICWRVGLLDGSRTNILLMRDLAFSEIETWSGKP